MDIKGKLVDIFDTTRVSDKFQKREFVVEYAENPSYPEYIKFELIQDKCDLLDSYKVNQPIQVHFNLKGRKWTDPQGTVKYFNTLQAWKLQAPDGDNSGASAGTGASYSQNTSSDLGQQKEPEWLSSDQNEDDLPF